MGKWGGECDFYLDASYLFLDEISYFRFISNSLIIFWTIKMEMRYKNINI